MVRQPTLQRRQLSVPQQTVALLNELFPLLSETGVYPSRKALRWLLTVLAVAAGAVVMLLRVGGRSPLDTIYAEDGSVFLLQALAAPGHLFISDGGYLELYPRIAGQIAALVPLQDATVVLALSGAIAAAGTGVFVYYASEGHVRSPWLRALLGASVILLPIAPMEIADSGVGAPWYLLFALFWATLWRPRSAWGKAVAAVIGFIATASTTMSFLLFPILVLRVAALRKVREHAVTIACAAGLVIQLIVAHASHHTRFHKLNSPGSVLAYYAHMVVLRSVGWHVSWWLQNHLGLNAATALVGALLVIVFGWVLITGSRRVRLFTVVALITGFISTVVPATLQVGVTLRAATSTVEPASRYTVVALFTLAAAAIVAVDGLRRRTGQVDGTPDPQQIATGYGTPSEEIAVAGGTLPRAERTVVTRAGAAAAAVLVAVLALGWVPDFRWAADRGAAAEWGPWAAQLLTSCQHSATGSITAPAWANEPQLVIPCANLHG